MNVYLVTAEDVVDTQVLTEDVYASLESAMALPGGVEWHSVSDPGFPEWEAWDDENGVRWFIVEHEVKL